MVNPAVIGVIGLGAGAALGYVAANAIGLAGAKLPKILLSRYSVPTGQTYNITCMNFPAKTQLVAPRSLFPPDIVNMGTTDSDGTLVLNGVVAQGAAGDNYIVVWNASNGMYCAMVTLTVT